MFQAEGSYSYHTIGGFRFLLAERESLSARLGPLRTHRRAVGISSNDPDLDGKVIFYSDTYAYRDEPKTYVYARHNRKPLDFLQIFDEFYATGTEEFEELRGSMFPFVINSNGRLVESSYEFPFARWFTDEDLNIRFIRVSMPFGNLSIEFDSPSVLTYHHTSQLMMELSENRFDSPLLAVETTRSNVLLPLLTQIHWASDRIPSPVLRQLAGHLSLSAVVA